MSKQSRSLYSKKLKNSCQTAGLYILLILALPVNSAVKIANIFRNNAVIQHGKPAPVWGLGTPGEKIIVTLTGVDGCKLNQRHRTVIGRTGKWVVTLSPLTAGDKFHIYVSGKSSKDAGYHLQAGDVWFYAGKYRFRYLRSIPQINTKSWKKENKDLFPLLRIYGTKDKHDIPQRRENGIWRKPEAYHVFGFSPGIAVQLGIELCREKKIPVGIVHVASIYGHSIDEYLSAEDFVKDPVLGKTNDAKKLAYRVGGTDECGKMNVERIVYMEKYLKDSIKRNAENKTVLQPEFPQYPKWAKTKTAILYNGSIHPLLPLAVKGVIFNDPNGPGHFDAKNHSAKLELLVNSFRKWFNDASLPIFIMQDKASRNQHTIRSNARFSSQQKLVRKDKNTEIVVTNDIEVFRKTSDLLTKTIPAKGHRVYMMALKKVYGKKSVKSEAPRITGYKHDKNKIIVKFSMPVHTFDGLPPDGFALKAKRGKRYRPAKAEIKGNSIIISAPGISNPEHANYCYVNRAIRKTPNVIGKNKMPLSAFSTKLLVQGGGK